MMIYMYNWQLHAVLFYLFIYAKSLCVHLCQFCENVTTAVSPQFVNVNFYSEFFLLSCNFTWCKFHSWDWTVGVNLHSSVTIIEAVVSAAVKPSLE